MSPVSAWVSNAHNTHLNGVSFLCQAIDGKNLHLATALIHSGVDVNLCLLDTRYSQSETGVFRSPLFDAIHKCDPRMVELLLQHGAVRTHDDGYGQTMCALSSACCTGDLETVKVLVEYGEDVHAIDAHGQSCLDCSAEGGHAEVSLYLIEQGVNHKSPRSDAIKLAQEEGHIECARVMVSLISAKLWRDMVECNTTAYASSDDMVQ